MSVAAEPAEAPIPAHFLKVGSDLSVGAEPASEAEFKTLADRGFRTIVSVDGAKPDVATAKKFGMRYVHIPFGYDGVPEKSRLMLARVVRDCEGPVYVHCHHGEHRGPAGAAMIGIFSGRLDQQGAIHLLERAGTSHDYAGLWRDVTACEPPPPDAKLPPLVEVAEVESLAAAMAHIDRLYDQVKAIEAAGWQTPADQPDLVPDRETLLLREAFREAARLLPPDRKALKPGLDACEMLCAEMTAAVKGGDAEAATAKLALLKANCSACHKQNRNDG